MNERVGFTIFEQYAPSSHPFMIVETFMSSDGLRSRICEGRWISFGEAEAERQRRMQGRS